MSAFALQSICLALSLLWITTCPEARENEVLFHESATVEITAAAARDHRWTHLNPANTIRDILNHPAFVGFSRLILPWDGRSHGADMPLSRIGSLLPFHSDVAPAVVTGALNRMIDDASKGRRVFYDIHTEAQKREDPTRQNTGLFFFRGRPGAPFAIISPGGGFAYVGAVHEGFPYAAEISRQGYNAFVLRYRAGLGSRVATEDLAAAISYVFRNADALGVSIQGYSLWGSSAGARMAAAIGSHGAAAFGGADLPKPATVVMAYTAHSDVSSDEPPTFVVVGERDGVAPPSAMRRRVASLRRMGTAVEYHEFPGLGHGFGPGTGTPAEGWIIGATRFWEKSIKGRDAHGEE